MDAESSPSLRTYLIADVRGYTRYTNEHGDEAGAEVASRFADLARRGVTAHGGELVELRGDEALAVFASARGALRAAVELQRLFRTSFEGQQALPLGVGIGLDAGEALPVEGGFRGGALNLAARLCSHAAAGEVLASETVVSLTRHVEGIRFRARGSRRFKGFDDPVNVIEVTPELPLPSLPSKRGASSTYSPSTHHSTKRDSRSSDRSDGCVRYSLRPCKERRAGSVPGCFGDPHRARPAAETRRER